jgi:hypothetical protein
MKKMVLLSLLLVFAFPFHAYSYTVYTDPGTVYNTTDIATYTTYGDTMDGLAVTAYFSVGGSETRSWTDLGFWLGGVSGNGWSLTEYNNTAFGTWTLTSTVAITRLVIDGRPGDTTFDIDLTNPVTAGSSSGLPITSNYTTQYSELTLPSALSKATYRNLLGVGGNPPLGDLYLVLDMEFVNANGFTGTMTFIADTDNVKYAGDIVPTPEPLTIILLGLGMTGLVGLKKN